MTRNCLILFLILFPCLAFSQTYINLDKAGVRKKLKNYVLENDSLKSEIKETAHSIHFTLKDPRTRPAEFIYEFDKAGKCMSERTIVDCDSCLRKFIQTALDRKEYGWKKVNENQYVSEFSKKMLLELPVDSADHHYSIIRTDWNKQMYDLLTAKQN